MRRSFVTGGVSGCQEEAQLTNKDMNVIFTLNLEVFYEKEDFVCSNTNDGFE